MTKIRLNNKRPTLLSPLIPFRATQGNFPNLLRIILIYSTSTDLLIWRLLMLTIPCLYPLRSLLIWLKIFLLTHNLPTQILLVPRLRKTFLLRRNYLRTFALHAILINPFWTNLNSFRISLLVVPVYLFSIFNPLY